MKNKEKYNLTELFVYSELIDCETVKLYIYDKDNNKIYETKMDMTEAYATNTTDKKYYNKWLEAEYKEPIRLTRNEKAILESIEKGWEYITRDENGDLWIHANKPYKSKYKNEENYGYWECDHEVWLELSCFNHLFQFIKWEDSEPHSIEELLKCEVVDDEC